MKRSSVRFATVAGVLSVVVAGGSALICGNLIPSRSEPGTAWFGPPKVISEPLLDLTSFAAADLDADGDIDLVVTRGILGMHHTNKVLWLENVLPDASNWNVHDVSSTEDVTRYATACDLDRDGDMDILFSSVSRVVWFENDGHGAGWAQHVIQQPTSDAQMVAAGDLDGDGDLDVVATQRSGNSVLWFENLDGRGTSWKSRTLASHVDPKALTLADVDGDGDLDVFVTGGTRVLGTQHRLALYVNLGQGASWKQRTLELGASYDYRTIAAVDLDGDADVDLVLGTDGGGNPGKAYWQENLAGDGTVWSAHLIDTSGALQYKSVVPADFDGDRDPDIFVGEGFRSNYYWLQNVLGNGTAWALQGLPEIYPGAPVQMLAADLDRDGDLDAVGTDGTTFWYENSP